MTEHNNTYITAEGTDAARRADAERIAKQSLTFNLYTEKFLHGLPIAPNGTLVDFGAGTGGAHPVLAEYAKNIISTDIEEPKLQMAEAYAKTAGLIDKAAFLYHQGGVESLDLPEGTIDTIYGRLIWQHLNEQTRAKEMTASINALKKGGLFIAEDMDLTTWKLEPTTPAFDFFIESLIQLYHAKGTEPQMGAKLVQFCEEAGLEIIKVNTYQHPVSGDNPFKRMHIGIFEATERGLTHPQFGIMTPEEYVTALAQLKSDILDTSRTAHTPHVTQIAARKKW